MGCRATDVLSEAMANFRRSQLFADQGRRFFSRKNAYFLGESPGASTSLCDRGFSPVWETAVSTCPPRGNLVDGLPRAPTYFFLTPKMTENHEIPTFRETRRGDSRKLLGYMGSVSECVRVSRHDFRISPQS